MLTKQTGHKLRPPQARSCLDTPVRAGLRPSGCGVPMHVAVRNGNGTPITELARQASPGKGNADARPIRATESPHPDILLQRPDETS
jgi:hypothetical protein